MRNVEDHHAKLLHPTAALSVLLAVRNRDIQMVKVGINYRFNWSGYGYGYGYGY